MPTLDWIGKQAVVNHHREVPYRLVHCDSELSAGDPDAANLLVQGDNLEALRALLPYYAGKVKCIYIDPPYNTGNEEWAYNDNVNSPEIRAWLEKTVGKEGEDLSRHDKWLCMMYPRLRLLREFLADDGVIFVSLDDFEASRCKILLSEIFGESNFIANLIWKKMDSPSSNVGRRIVSNYHDHILWFAKNKAEADLIQLPSPDILNAYPVVMNGKRARWRQLRKNGKAARRADRPNSWFKMIAPDKTEVWPVHPKEGWEGRWSIGPDTWKTIENTDEVKWERRPYGWTPYRIEYAKDVPTMPLASIIDDVSQNRQAKAQLNQILGTNHGFETPKPYDLVELLISLCGDQNALVLDSFCGSGTTGHATLALNGRDGGNRRFILIEMDQTVAKSVAAPRLSKVVEGYKTFTKASETIFERKIGLKELRAPETVLNECEEIKDEKSLDFDEIERSFEGGTLRLVGARPAGAEVPGLGGGFRFCQLGVPLFDEFGDIAGDVAFADLAAHIFFSETGVPIPHRASSELLGVFQDRAVYLLFDPAHADTPREAIGNVLTPDRLNTLPPGPEDFTGTHVIYAEGCTVSAERLKRAHAVFKQIPYQIEGA
ncbi:site-specific DNA-methyltransferase [Maricaulis salignorans]|uniref:site-specific DNA-methyltransferase (adenine-specific) n=1 Tax=Maricaulis salignorans TaxID=144026 RepID=A0A1G9SQ92_9PROT|nr:site-specific DNA-methyltransferase [Maricaulis salignorans]SDM37550.1 adenine-specific DNA-methyltransferase [Maricaulis salignorans]